jgi:hypothetical protein
MKYKMYNRYNTEHILLYKGELDKDKLYKDGIILEKINNSIKLFENYDNISIEDKLRYFCLIYGNSYAPNVIEELGTSNYRKYDRLYNEYTGMATISILDIHTNNISKEDIDPINKYSLLMMNMFKETYGVDFRVFEDEFILITDYTDITLNYSGIVYEIDNKEIKIELPEDDDPNSPIKKRSWKILDDMDYLRDFANSIGMKVAVSRYTATFKKK